jgi:hypothetical protein
MHFFEAYTMTMTPYLAIFLIVALAILVYVSERTHREISRGLGVLVSGTSLQGALELADRADAGLSSQDRPYRILVMVASDWAHHTPPVATMFPDSLEVLLIDDRAVRKVPREVFDIRESRLSDRSVSMSSTRNRRVMIAKPVTTACTGDWRLSH